jgi:membrane protein implicated in regulation of membrane protease activity
MTSIFLFALIVGGGLLALSFMSDLLGGAESGFDVDLDTDFDADLDADLDPGLDAGAPAGGEVDVAGAFRVFTIRNTTYFLFGFGAVGWSTLQLSPGASVLLTTVAAVLAGLLAAALATAAFGWLRATDSGFQSGEGSFVGCEGRVVLPLGHGKMGQIVVQRSDREYELRALPFDTSAASPGAWRSVMVIEMDGGTARVSPMEALTPAGDEPAD